VLTTLFLERERERERGTARRESRVRGIISNRVALSLSRSLYGTDYSTLSLVEREYVVHSLNSKEREGLSLSLKF